VEEVRLERGVARVSPWCAVDHRTIDLLKPHVAELVVCNPRKNALLNAGNKSDRIDARKLA
jgi:hypothetical protein